MNRRNKTKLPKAGNEPIRDPTMNLIPLIECILLKGLNILIVLAADKLIPE